LGSFLAFKTKAFACASRSPSIFKKSRKAFNCFGYYLLVSGDLRAYSNTVKGFLAIVSYSKYKLVHYYKMGLK